MLFLRVKFDSSITCKCSIVNSFKNLVFTIVLYIVHFFLTLIYSVYLFHGLKLLKHTHFTPEVMKLQLSVVIMIKP